MTTEARGGVGEDTLDRLASEGLLAVGGRTLRPLADWAWDACEETGRGAYGSVSVTLRRIDRWWGEYSAIPVDLLSALDEILTTRLPEVLAAEDSRQAANLARDLRHAVEQLLLPPEQWQSRHADVPR